MKNSSQKQIKMIKPWFIKSTVSLLHPARDVANGLDETGKRRTSKYLIEC